MCAISPSMTWMPLLPLPLVLDIDGHLADLCIGCVIFSKGRVSFIVGDLGKMTASELDTAVKGVDAVVSALMGDPDAMVKGQIALIDAAKRAGVRQFLPSAFGSESRAVSKVLSSDKSLI